MPLDSALPALDVDADFWSLRFVEEASDDYVVRKNVALPLTTSLDRGVMASVYADGGYGYAATGDTSPDGLKRVLQRARHLRAHPVHTRRVVSSTRPTLQYPSPKQDLEGRQ